QPRKINVAGEIVGELLDLHVVAAPERDAIELHFEAGAGKRGDEQLVVPQLLAGAHREWIRAAQAEGLELDRSMGRALRLLTANRHRRLSGCDAIPGWQLCGYDEPLVGFRDAGGDRAIGGVPLGFGLALLAGR